MKKRLPLVNFGFFFRNTDPLIRKKLNKVDIYYDQDIIHSRDNINFYRFTYLKKIPAIIRGIFINSESHKLLKMNDLIISIEGYKIKNLYDFFRAKTKLKWNTTINFEVKRNNQSKKLKIPLRSFEEWKENYPRVGIDVKEQDNQIKVSDIANFSSVTFELLDDRTINNGDIIISLNGKKIKTLKDWDQGYSTLIPNKLARFVIQPKDSSKKIKTNIKIINFNKFLELNRKFCMSYWPKEGAKILLKEYEEYNFYLDEKYKSKVLAKFWNKKNTDTIIKKVIKKLKK